MEIICGCTFIMPINLTIAGDLRRKSLPFCHQSVKFILHSTPQDGSIVLDRMATCLARPLPTCGYITTEDNDGCGQEGGVGSVRSFDKVASGFSFEASRSVVVYWETTAVQNGLHCHAMLHLRGQRAMHATAPHRRSGPL